MTEHELQDNEKPEGQLPNRRTAMKRIATLAVTFSLPALFPRCSDDSTNTPAYYSGYMSGYSSGGYSSGGYSSGGYSSQGNYYTSTYGSGYYSQYCSGRYKSYYSGYYGSNTYNYYCSYNYRSYGSTYTSQR